MTAAKRPLVGLATAAEEAELDEDGQTLIRALDAVGLDAQPVVWTDAEVDYSRFDLVVVRATWDYPRDLARFLDWTRTVEQTTALLNPAALIAWNVDKTYLADLAAAGVPVVPSHFVAPGEPREHPYLDVEHVVKPTVSAGSKDTLRLSPDERERSIDHVGAINASGRTALVQPYLAQVDEVGETGMIFIDGGFSHAIRKGAILEPGAGLIDGLFAPEQISPRTPSASEIEVGEQVLGAVARRAGGATPPLYARIDVLPTEEGPRLLELELIEPSLFLDHVPDAAPGVAGAIHARLGL